MKAFLHLHRYVLAIFICSSCSFDASQKNLRNNVDFAEDDDSDRIIHPTNVTGAFLTYNSAKIGCTYEKLDSQPKTYEISCLALTEDNQGNEIATARLEKGLSLTWLEPTVSEGAIEEIDCDLTNKQILGRQCRVKASSDFLSLKFSISLQFNGEKREEHDVVVLPFAVSNAYGLVPTLPILEVKNEHQVMRKNSFGRQRQSFPVSELNGLGIFDKCALGESLFVLISGGIIKISGRQAVHYAGGRSISDSMSSSRFDTQIAGRLLCKPSGLDVVSYDEEPNGLYKIYRFDQEDSMTVVFEPNPFNVEKNGIMNLGDSYAPDFRFQDTDGNLVRTLSIGQQTLDLNTVQDIVPGEAGEYFYTLKGYGNNEVYRITAETKGIYFFFQNVRHPSIFTSPGFYGYTKLTRPFSLSYSDSSLYITATKHFYSSQAFVLLKVHRENGPEVLVAPSSGIESLVDRKVDRTVLNIENAVLDDQDQVIISDKRGLLRVSSDQAIATIPANKRLSKVLPLTNAGFFATFFESQFSNDESMPTGLGWFDEGGELKSFVKGKSAYYGSVESPVPGIENNLPGVIGSVTQLNSDQVIVASSLSATGIPLVFAGAMEFCESFNSWVHLVRKNGEVTPLFSVLNQGFETNFCQISSIDVDDKKNIYVAIGQEIKLFKLIDGGHLYDSGTTVFQSDKYISQLQWRTDNKIIFTERSFSQTTGIKLLDLSKNQAGSGAQTTSLYAMDTNKTRCGYGELAGETTLDRSEKSVSISLNAICIEHIDDIFLKDNCLDQRGSYTLLMTQLINGVRNLVRVTGPCKL